MGDARRPEILSLSNPDAAQWNRDLMLAFQAELERNPEADLMSMSSDAYCREHRGAQYRQLSYAGQINSRTLHELEAVLRHEPETNLLSEFPRNYNRRITMTTGPKVEKEPAPVQVPDFRARLDLAETATVVFPLSEQAVPLLGQYTGEFLNDDTSDAGKGLATSLKRLLWKSPKLWESPIRGVVVKCNDAIVAKVIGGNTEDYTEYTSMQYLAERAPDIPAPRPHGLIQMGPFRVIFMSYIPDTTLAQTWPSLSHEEKLSIQQQLEDIFRRLRSLRQDDGKMLGGVCGEGAKDHRNYGSSLFKNVTTATELSDLQFSARHYGSDTYVRLLRSLLMPDHGSVFSHGDVRTDNIVVKRDHSGNGRYIVTGIIDWEDSGFYPAYHECTALTRTLSLVDEDDWYLYLPPSISPSAFPVRWLVDRLWSIHLRTT